MSKYSTDFKLQVVNEYLKLGGQKRVAYLFNICQSDVRKWSLAYQAHGLSGLNPGPKCILRSSRCKCCNTLLGTTYPLGQQQPTLILPLPARFGYGNNENNVF